MVCFGIVRTAFGYLLLDRDGLAAIRDRAEGQIAWSKRPANDFRKFALARAAPWRLARVLDRLPAPCVYYNVGHSNLTDRVLSALTVAGVPIHVLIHDVIPLEYPEFQRPGTVAPFREKMKRVQKRADRVIFNSEDTQRRATAVMSQWGTPPPGIVAHLGTMMPRPDPSGLPENLPPRRPYFVTVGTIEPRKNHAFLLDIWDRLGPDAPPLLICGARGWNNEAVFSRLDALDPDGPVREIPNLTDAALAALVANAVGALFPSLAEGFGLPPLEAVMLGTRVLCNDLDVFHEFLGDMPVYAAVSDHYQWDRVIKAWASEAGQQAVLDGFAAPTWDAHFNTVLSLRD